MTFPPGPAGPSASVSNAAVAHRDRRSPRRWHRCGSSSTNAQRPFRPSESRLTADAPRAVYQVVLPEDLDGGYIVVYEFPDAAAAVDAATTSPATSAPAPAGSPYPLDAQHTIRQRRDDADLLHVVAVDVAQDPGRPALGVAGRPPSTLGIGVRAATLSAPASPGRAYMGFRVWPMSSRHAFPRQPVQHVPAQRAMPTGRRG